MILPAEELQVVLEQHAVPYRMADGSRRWMFGTDPDSRPHPDYPSHDEETALKIVDTCLILGIKVSGVISTEFMHTLVTRLRALEELFVKLGPPTDDQLRGRTEGREQTGG